MNHIELCHVRPSLSVASFSTFSPNPHRNASFSALAVALLAGFAIAWGSPSGAASSGQPAIDGSPVALAAGCASGDAVSCNDLGVGTLHGDGVRADATQAFSAFQRGCERGSPDACSNLGALYESGAGVQADLARAAALYQQACAAGAALGCSNLGALYARGRGVERNHGEARRLFALACESGSAAGCNNAILFSSAGARGVPAK